MTRRAGDGKAFRDELHRALRLHLGARTWCFDNTGSWGGARRPGDLEACYRGRSLLLEAKETRSGRVGFRRLADHQQAALAAQEEAGGLGLVAVKWVGSNWSRAWLCRWPDWRDLQDTLGRASVPLRDGKRPECLREVLRVDLDPARVDRVWDLRGVLGEWIGGD